MCRSRLLHRPATSDGHRGARRRALARSRRDVAHHRARRIALCGLLLLIAGAEVDAQLRLADVFGDHMVLQRDQALPLWGAAFPGETVRVRFAGVEASTHAGADGRWRLSLDPLPAGGPWELLVVSAGEPVVVRDVLVGEVWICAGASNMALPVRLADGAHELVVGAGELPIRFVQMSDRPAGEPLVDASEPWQKAHAGTVAELSAVAWSFARRLHDELAVPVGIVEAAVPFSRIEPWIPAAGFAEEEGLRWVLGDIERAKREYAEELRPRLQPFAAWLAAARSALSTGTELPPMPDLPSDPIEDIGRPTALFNGMVRPWVSFGVRGVVWAQGEQNIGEGALYTTKLRALVRGWRGAWDGARLPFVLVQLAPYRYGRTRPTERPGGRADPGRLPEMWSAQSAALALDDTGLVVTTDLGELDNIYFTDKRSVADRAVRWALHHLYGRADVVPSGPMLEAATREGRAVRLRFRYGAGMRSRDGQPLADFEIAGIDGEFAPARATIEGATVVVASEPIESPVAVRFGWHQEAQPNLVNSAGLPASPFQWSAEGTSGEGR